ncbi:MAG: hypothetical protein ACYTHN_14750 [Planctomycetota bacterium]|jgi:hypothetical protein
MRAADDLDADADEGAEIEQGTGPAIEKAKPSTLGQFLAMVLSGVLSLFIASVMFSIGVVWGYREDARELRGLVQFFSVEAVEVFADTADAAEMKLVYGERQEGSSPRMVSAVSLGRANALRVDPSLMATLRSIYGRHARILRDLKTFKRGGKWYQMTAVINECKTMGKEVRHVLKIANEEGVADEALKSLRARMSDAESRIDTIVKTQKDLFPAVWMTKRISSIPVRIKKMASRNFQVRNWSPDEPLTITKVTSSMEFVTLVLPEKMTVEPLGETRIVFEISPKNMEPGPFEGTIIVETDRPGFEKLTLSVSGRIYPAR